MSKGPFLPPSLDALEAMARSAFDTIPDELRQHVSRVVIRVAEFPDAEVEAEFDLESPFDLLGLYHGVSMDRKSVADPDGGIDMIFLYRRPILDYWVESGEPLWRIVRHVVIHECGHHFGFSDDDMTRIEEGP
jgi:predicted Zn-dependent protease with MMP-like domain